MGQTGSSAATATPQTHETRSAVKVTPARRRFCVSFTRRPPWKDRNTAGSVPAADTVNHSDLQLTGDDKKRIRTTWSLVSRDLWSLVSRDPYRIGARVFLRIFQLAPEARKLFRFNGMSETELVVNGLFRIHSSRFIRAIELAVNNLDALDLVVVSNLIQLGRQHARIVGFRVEYLDAFRSAMVDVWRAELGSEQFTAQTQKAWSTLFLLITNSVLEGYQQRCAEPNFTKPSLDENLAERSQTDPELSSESQSRPSDDDEIA